ncbi:hypothetical protein BGLT_04108 [Caballeronia glathei]|jgi:hypothetical protein|uniref:Uncharacterized protein n=1 Tax=Caballeronia glathei TaxID=60547 RepID=A0A069Q1H5_9BURK|nr:MULTISPECIES: hypothetical protein [Burkholderiaceae]KDR43581.1 hypothetical protein BG61_35790 [Caballeronia glathei]TCK39107.1 hypothetical protein B0G84_4436 [Paraburkholderia sp. BL8N3]CDY75210.1 hypothetical protein BGLT_04108 [Caballeronia glathei]
MNAHVNLVSKLAAMSIAATSAALAALPAQASVNDYRIKLVNETGLAIRAFHATNIFDPDPGPNLLWRHMLPPRFSAVVDTDDASGVCLFDFETVLSSGHVIEDRAVNVCDTWTYRIAPRMPEARMPS